MGRRRYYDDYDYYEESRRPNYGARIARMVILFLAIFAVTTAVVVTQRLSNDTLALIIGAAGVGIPLLLLLAGAGWALLKISQNRQPQAQPYYPQPQQPLVLMLPPQPQQSQPQLPLWGDDGSQQPLGGREREWEVIGDEEKWRN